MDAFQFLQKHGKPTCEKVAKEAGTNWAYFSQIAYGHRRPSPDMADRLVEASTKFCRAAERLDFVSLLRPKSRAA